MKVKKDAVKINEIGDTEIIGLNQIRNRIEALEEWKNIVEPWRENVNIDINTLENNQSSISTQIDTITTEIKKIKDSNNCIYIRDIVIISSLILMIIYIIIVSLK